MPNVTVYIRTGDLEKWKQLQGKSEFIHNALKGVPAKDEPLIFSENATIVKVSEKIKTSDFSGGIPKSFSARKKK